MFFISILVFSLAGFGIPLIFLFSLVIAPLRLHIQRKKNGIVRVKKQRGTIPELIFAALFLLVMLALSTWSIYIVIPYYRDIPALITGKYNTENGVVNKVQYYKRQGKNWGYDSITIDGKDYKFSKIKISPIDSRVTFSYLPYTKIIKDIEQVW